MDEKIGSPPKPEASEVGGEEQEYEDEGSFQVIAEKKDQIIAVEKEVRALTARLCALSKNKKETHCVAAEHSSSNYEELRKMIEGRDDESILQVSHELGNSSFSVDNSIKYLQSLKRDRGQGLEGISESAASFKQGQAILCDMFSLLRQAIEAAPPICVTDVLQKEFENIPNIVNKLSGEGCRVAIFGDLKVGKSSFINFLLGDDILASKVEHCTSTITEVVYGERFRIFAQKMGQNELVEYSVDDRFTAKQNLDVFLAADLEHRCSIQYDLVQIQFPSPLLKSGIVLVDSPGLNENSNFDTLTKKYLTNAVGIICVINADPGLTLTVEQAIAQVKEACLCPEFLFVCNKIDTIKKEADKVAKTEEIRKKLVAMNIPNFEQEDLVAFSTTQAVAARSYGVISQYLDNFNCKLTRHMNASFKHKLRMNYNEQHLIFKRLADAVYLVAEVTDPKRKKFEEMLKLLHEDVCKQVLERDNFLKNEQQLFNKWRAKVQEVYQNSSDLKKNWHSYAEKHIQPSPTLSQEYEVYVESMLQKELVLRLDKIDSETGILAESYQDILKEANATYSSLFEDGKLVKTLRWHNKLVQGGLAAASATSSFLFGATTFVFCAGIFFSPAAVVAIPIIVTTGVVGLGSLCKMAVNRHRGRVRKTIVDDFVEKMDEHVREITDRKFNKLEDSVNLVLYALDKKIAHSKAILERLTRVGVQSANAQEYFAEFNKTAEAFETAATHFRAMFLGGGGGRGGGELPQAPVSTPANTTPTPQQPSVHSSTRERVKQFIRPGRKNSIPSGEPAAKPHPHGVPPSSLPKHPPTNPVVHQTASHTQQSIETRIASHVSPSALPTKQPSNPAVRPLPQHACVQEGGGKEAVRALPLRPPVATSKQMVSPSALPAQQPVNSKVPPNACVQEGGVKQAATRAPILRHPSATLKQIVPPPSLGTLQAPEQPKNSLPAHSVQHAKALFEQQAVVNTPSSHTKSSPMRPPRTVPVSSAHISTQAAPQSDQQHALPLSATHPPVKNLPVSSENTHAESKQHIARGVPTPFVHLRHTPTNNQRMLPIN